MTVTHIQLVDLFSLNKCQFVRQSQCSFNSWKTQSAAVILFLYDKMALRLDWDVKIVVLF